MLYRFYLDEEGEKQILRQMFAGWSGCSVEERAWQYGIPVEIARQCEGNDKPCANLNEFMAKGYQTYSKELKQALVFHRKYWKEHGSAYKQKLETIFGRRIPVYSVRLNLQCDGISNWYGSDISINAFQYLRANKFLHVKTLLWETILSLTFMEIRKIFKPEQLEDNQVWGISELTAVSCIQTDFEENDNDWEIGYRELEPYRKIVKHMYAGRTDFMDYLRQVTAYFKKNPITQGC